MNDNNDPSRKLDSLYEDNPNQNNRNSNQDSYDRQMTSLREDKGGNRVIGLFIFMCGVGIAGYSAYIAWKNDNSTVDTSVSQNDKDYVKPSVKQMKLPDESFTNPNSGVQPIRTTPVIVNDVQPILENEGLSQEQLLRLEARLRREEQQRLQRLTDIQKAKDKVDAMWKRKYAGRITTAGAGGGISSGNSSGGSIGGSPLINPIDPITGKLDNDKYDAFLKQRLSMGIEAENKERAKQQSRSSGNGGTVVSRTRIPFGGFSAPGSTATSSGSYEHVNNNVAGTPSIDAMVVRDSQYKILQGKIFGAILETAISSDNVGMVRAVSTEPVYSYDGSRILIPVSSRLIGTYKGISDRGQTRIGILWERVITPDNISIALNSQSTDELGRVGASGMVDNHFIERFGATFLLSLIASQVSEDDDSTNNGARAFEESASIALEDSIKIKPTFHKNQGERIRIFVQHDFSLKNLFVRN